MKTLLETYYEALDRGDTAEAARLANSINWNAIVPLVKRELIRQINFAALPKAGERDVEGAILARDERRMLAMDGLA